MRRGVWLMAAAGWLLAPGCASEPVARAPHQARTRKARPASVAMATRRPSHAAQTRQNPPEIATPSEVAPGRFATPGPSSEELRQRFGAAHALARLTGSGSYYADFFAGRKTASGAPYDPSGFTAAHRSLPFGTVLRVTRVDGGQTVYVRVTDRGPYGPRGRILDLSKAAAEQLGMLRAGVVSLRVDVLEYGPRKSRRRKH
jgi:rare lipoprotein A